MSTPQIALEQTAPVAHHSIIRLAPEAALAYRRASLAAGIWPVISDGWRSLETQAKIFLDRYVKGDHRGEKGYTDDRRAWQGSYWTRKSGTAAAAVPGTSNHGAGFAFDAATHRQVGTPPRPSVVFTGWSDDDRLNWLAAAKKHGWADNEGWAVSEHWHITYCPRDDHHLEHVIFVGTRGDAVTEAQIHLARALRLNLDLDGDFGPLTKSAVQDFQRRRGLKDDGIIGLQTWAELVWTLS